MEYIIDSFKQDVFLTLIAFRIGSTGVWWIIWMKQIFYKIQWVVFFFLNEASKIISDLIFVIRFQVWGLHNYKNYEKLFI